MTSLDTVENPVERVNLAWIIHLWVRLFLSEAWLMVRSVFGLGNVGRNKTELESEAFSDGRDLATMRRNQVNIILIRTLWKEKDERHSTKQRELFDKYMVTTIFQTSCELLMIDAMMNMSQLIFVMNETKPFVTVF